MEKFPKVKYPNDPETDGLKNDEVVVTEKLDGANFRFTWDEDGTLNIGTRNVVYEDALDNEDLPKSFEHAVEYISRRGADLFDPNITFYGEAMHRHSLVYDDIDYYNPPSGAPHPSLDSDTPNVVLFDARDDDGWLDWDEFCEIVAPTDFEITKITERGDPDGLSYEVPETSMFGGEPEGIVARRVDGQVRAKKVTESFREQNAVTFEDPGKASTDAAAFVAAFVTNARIEKQMHKLVDEGGYDRPQMQMMEDLPRAVLTDAIEENAWDLITSGGFAAEWDDDFKAEVRSKASKKCARVLKEELQSL